MVDRPSALAAFGGRISSYTAIFGAGAGITVLLALVQVAVLTRFLDPSEFGRLAILFFFSVLLTTVFNLGTLQGSFMYIFGRAGDEDGGDVEDGEDAEAATGQKKRALGSALGLTVVIASAGGLVIVPFAGPLADLLTGSADDSDAVLLATACGSTGAVWRLVVNIPRQERRPVLYTALSTLRPVLVLGLAVGFVVAGHGVEGVLAGTAIATGISIVAGIAWTRRSYAVAFDVRMLPSILRLGLPFAPVTLGFWVIVSGDLFLLSRFATDAEVGIYRVASRVASPISYVLSSFTLAWPPLRRSALAAAADKERGKGSVGALLTTYLVLGSLWILLALYVAADVLVRIAPESYSGGASIVPLLGAALVLQAVFVMLNRVSRIRRKRVVFPSLASLAALVFVGAGLLLVPAMGGEGAALAAITGFGAATIGVFLASRLGPEPIPFQWRRLGTALAIAPGSVAVMLVAGRMLGDVAAAAVEVSLVLAFPGLLVLTGAVPKRELAVVLGMLRAPLARRRARRGGDDDFVRLTQIDAAALELLLRHRRSPAEIAALLSTTEKQVYEMAVAVLRRFSEAGAATSVDAAIGGYLLSEEPVAERDMIARQLLANGVDPRELDILEQAVAKLRRTPGRVWLAVGQPMSLR